MAEQLIDSLVVKPARTKLRKAYLIVSKRLGVTWVSIRDVKKEFENIKGSSVSDERFAKIVKNNYDVYSVNLEIARKKREGIKIDRANIGIIGVFPNDPPTEEKGLKYI